MKRVKIIMEIDLGVFPNESDLSEQHLLRLYHTVEKPPWVVETPLQIVVEDVDTGLISNLIPLGETLT